MWIWNLQTWCDGEHDGSAKLTVELDDLKCLFKFKDCEYKFKNSDSGTCKDSFAFSGNPSHKIPSNALG